MKAEISTDGVSRPLEEIAQEIAAPEPKPEPKKRGRPPGQKKAAQKTAQKTVATVAEEPPGEAESVAQYAALFSLIMPGFSRALSSKLGEGVGWTPEEISEAAPIFGRVAHKYMGMTAYGDEIALLSALVMPPAMRYIMRKMPTGEPMPEPPPYNPEPKPNGA